MKFCTLAGSTPLTEPFGLIVAGWNARKATWHTLGDMLHMSNTETGFRGFQDCLVRIFTGADYLARWRAYFARKLGFSVIPGSRNEPEPELNASSKSADINGVADLNAWMKKSKITDAELGKAIGKSRSWVSSQRSGRRSWSPGFQEAVNRYITGMIENVHQAP
jgi:hypothetical protein